MSTAGSTDLHRRKSITKGDVTAPPKRVYKSHLDRPVHSPRMATLQWGNARPPLNGFLNLGLVLALCGASSFIIGNVNRHGFRVAPSYWLDVLRVDGRISLAPLALFIPLPVFAGGTYLIEKRIAAGVLADNLTISLNHIAWILLTCIYPMVTMALFGQLIPFLPALLGFIAYTAVMLKTWSYAQTNRWCREKKATVKNEECDEGVVQQTPGIVNGPRVEYPANLTVKDFAYFIVAPTLCYELNYPKTERRNYAAIAYRLVEFVICSFIFTALIQQWMIPAFKGALQPYSKGDTWVFLEKMLITAVAENILWLTFFYLVFHSLLILLAEILCFADKKFYDTWWQAENLDSFWRKWNLPVHNWAVRHLYIPMLRCGLSKRVSQYVVFILSGIFHEYVCSASLRMASSYFIMGFILQIPLSDLTLYIERRYSARVSNAVIWLAIVIGQCCSLLFYANNAIADQLVPSQLT